MRPIKFLSLISLFMGSCSFLSGEAGVPLDNLADQCIASFQTFSYYPQAWKQYFEPGLIYPLPPWREEAVLPQGSSESLIQESRFVGARISNAGVDIWIERNEFSGGQWTGKYLIYNPATSSWKQISGQITETGSFVGHAYISESGNIWGVNLYRSRFEGRNPTISKFDFGDGDFKAIAEIPIKDLNENLITFDSSKEVFWLVSPNDGIYSYDLEEQKLTKHKSIPGFQVSEIYSLDSKKIYMSLINFESKITELNIYEYSVDSNSLFQIKPPSEEWPNNGSLFVSSDGKLWLGANGWIDADHSWYLLHPKTELYLTDIWSPYSSSPVIILESTGGVLWLQRALDTRADGIAWYDPETSKGCWITTLTGDIVEDHLHRLWLLAGEGLFRFD